MHHRKCFVPWRHYLYQGMRLARNPLQLHDMVTMLGVTVIPSLASCRGKGRNASF